MEDSSDLTGSQSTLLALHQGGHPTNITEVKSKKRKNSSSSFDFLLQPMERWGKGQEMQTASWKKYGKVRRRFKMRRISWL
jgi:hypothetical protein